MDDILSTGVGDREVLTQYYGGTAPDASLLLAWLVRFLPPDDRAAAQLRWRSAKG